MTMPYTYDTDRAPLWADSVRGELVADPKAYAETKPGKLTEAELDRAIAQKRRDTICAASQAPRIPRNRPIVGTSQQGRVIHRSGDIPQPTEPCMSELDWVRFDRRVLYPVCVLALLACAAAVFDVRWTDAVQLLAVIGGAR